VGGKEGFEAALGALTLRLGDVFESGVNAGFVEVFLDHQELLELHFVRLDPSQLL
jgi:hypothetical protein